jgi:hypothetical protein
MAEPNICYLNRNTHRTRGGSRRVLQKTESSGLPTIIGKTSDDVFICDCKGGNQIQIWRSRGVELQLPSQLSRPIRTPDSVRVILCRLNKIVRALGDETFRPLKSQKDADPDQARTLRRKVSPLKNVGTIPRVPQPAPLPVCLPIRSCKLPILFSLVQFLAERLLRC